MAIIVATSVSWLYLKIPQDVRSIVATKLQLGVDIGRILDDIREGISENDGVGREHLIDRQDVLNIRRYREC